jgi:dipeptidase D
MKQNLILKYFSEICKIPHVSGQEQALANYIIKLLKKNKCKVQTDKLGNVYVFKQGKLKTPGVCFQGHLDMVGEKTLESNHNFKTDPIDFYEDHG